MNASKICLGFIAAYVLTLSVGASAETSIGALDEADLMVGAVSPEELEESRGRQNQDLRIDIDEINMSVQQNDNEQSATLRNNMINGAVSGNNWIASGAMSGMNGIATVIQNSGNQVIIQDTTMVNIMIRP